MKKEFSVVFLVELAGHGTKIGYGIKPEPTKDELRKLLKHVQFTIGEILEEEEPVNA